MATDKELQEMEEKMKTYEKALDDTIKKLALKRTELSTLAKTKLEDLEKEIPTLENQIQTRQDKVIELDELIFEKKEKYETEYNSCVDHYIALESQLKKDYAEKNEYLDRRHESQEIRDCKFISESAKLEADVQNRELAIEQSKNELSKREENLAKELKEFNSSKDLFNAQVSDVKTEFEDTRRSLDARDKDLAQKHAEADKIIKEAQGLKVQYESTIAKIAELDAKENELNDRAKALDEKESILNTENARLKAESVRMNKRNDEQNDRENRLNQRDANLKVLEAKV
jgi:chromosome segregation ATPase